MTRSRHRAVGRAAHQSGRHFPRFALVILCVLLVPLVVAPSNAATTGSGADQFNRADGGLGAAWTAISDGALSISSNVVVGTSGLAGDIRSAETYGSDQYSSIQVTSTQLSGDQWLGAAVRMQNGGQGMYVGIYYWNSGRPQLRLYRRSGGNWTQLGASYTTTPLAAGATLKVSAVGSAISFFQDGTKRIGATDTTYTGGAPGVVTSGAASGDNWSGGDTAGAGSFSVGGTVSGLTGAVVLQDNGGDDLTIPADGQFTFATKVASGSSYAVT